MPHPIALALLASSAALMSTTTLASQALATKNDCFGCHAVATRVVGPAYREVGAKYAGQPGAEDQLVHSIREGSTGRWGDLAMPPHPKLSETDAHRLAKWILAGAK
jgi:cytochrome c